MIRLILYLAALALATLAAVWIADHPGRVEMRWEGWAVDTSVAVLTILVATIAGVSALIYRLWRWLRGSPRRMVIKRARRRRDRGYRALMRGLAAAAGGDAKLAGREAARAEVLIRDPALTLLLSAQAAQLSGNHAAAGVRFTAMLDQPETEFLGLRGLLGQALRDGDAAAARRLAVRAHALRPDAEWVAETLYDLHGRAGDWAAALTTVKAAARHGLITERESRRRQAVLLCEQARAGDGALGLARQAAALAPALAPAATMAARLLTAAGKRRRAARLIEASWAAAPHPDLAAAYADIRADATPLKRFKRFEALAAANPAHAESHLVLAEAALDASLWGAARNHLEQALAAQPGARACALMARLEEADEEGGGAAAAEWRARAAEPGADPVWLCAACDGEAARWSALCPHCGAFESITWRAGGLAAGGPGPALAAAEDHPRLPPQTPATEQGALPPDLTPPGDDKAKAE